MATRGSKNTAAATLPCLTTPGSASEMAKKEANDTTRPLRLGRGGPRQNRESPRVPFDVCRGHAEARRGAWGMALRTSSA